MEQTQTQVPSKILDDESLSGNSTHASFEEVYEFERFLQEGAFSMVGCARHKESDKRYAVKVLDKSQFKTDKQKWRVSNEIKIHRSLNHDNIVKYHEHFESETDIYIVLELLEGGELHNRVSDVGWFSETEASQIIRQITEAIRYLHDLGIVHRDIKPENILFTSNISSSPVKLIDFGLAKQMSNEQGRAFLMKSSSGTPAFCAPERFSSAEESKAVDMWSLGCIMYLLLFAAPPFVSTKEDEEEHDDEVINAVINNKISLDKRPISHAAKDLLMRLLNPRPSERITADEVLEHVWIIEPPTIDQQMEDVSSVAAGTAAGNQTSFSMKMERDLLKSSMNKVIDFNSANIFSP